MLRIRADHDRPRQKLVELGAAASLVASELGDEQAALARLVKRECDAILERAAILQSDAVTQLGAAVAQARHGLGKWLAKHRGDGDQQLNSAHGRPTSNDRVCTECSRTTTSISGNGSLSGALQPPRSGSKSPVLPRVDA